MGHPRKIYEFVLEKFNIPYALQIKALSSDVPNRYIGNLALFMNKYFCYLPTCICTVYLYTKKEYTIDTIFFSH